MSDIYVRSSDGNNTDSGATWALAKATLAGAAAIDVAGDRIFLSQSHSETTAGAVVLSFAGTLASPSQVLCANDSAEPPTSLAATAAVSTSGNSNITVNGSVHVHGVAFSCGVGASGSASILLSNDVGQERQQYENCDFVIGTTAASQALRCGSNGGGRLVKITMKNCRFKFSEDTQCIYCYAEVHMQGGSIMAGSVVNDQGFLNLGGTNIGSALVDGFDFSNSPAGLVLITSFSGNNRAIFRNCKMPAGWTGKLVKQSNPSLGSRYEMWNCDNADTNYRLWIEDYNGTIKNETTLVKTGGASDGTTPISWKMSSNANAEFPMLTLNSPEIYSEFISSVGSPKTITVDVLHDSVTALKDDEIWLHVQYLGTSGRPISLFANDCKASVLASGASQASSSATWTTTGMANPNKQKLEVTFTPEEKGVAIVTVYLAKASTTVYVDPIAQIS